MEGPQTGLLVRIVSGGACDNTYQYRMQIPDGHPEYTRFRRRAYLPVLDANTV
jgi:hypothetical protein